MVAYEMLYDVTWWRFEKDSAKLVGHTRVDEDALPAYVHGVRPGPCYQSYRMIVVTSLRHALLKASLP